MKLAAVIGEPRKISIGFGAGFYRHAKRPCWTSLRRRNTRTLLDGPGELLGDFPDLGLAAPKPTRNPTRGSLPVGPDSTTRFPITRMAGEPRKIASATSSQREAAAPDISSMTPTTGIALP